MLLKTLSKELNDIRTNSAYCFEADLKNLKAIQQLGKKYTYTFGDKIDVLINNASSFYPTPLNDITEEQWQDLAGTNALAPAFLCKGLLPGPAT